MESKYEIKKEEFHFRTETNGDKKTPLECNAHMHYEIEYFLLLEGETVVYIDSMEYKLNAGDLCVVFPNQIHQFKTLSEEKYMLIIFSPDMVPELTDTFTSRIPRSAVLRAAELTEDCEKLMRRMGEINSSMGEYRRVQMRGMLLTFFGFILDKMSLTDVKSVSSHALKTVVNYCARNFSRDLSLSILEEDLHISKYYISHLFSMKLKVRFNDYINSLRINDACRQLRQTDKTVTEISECVGFNTLRTFNRAFVRQIGMSPSEYRKQGEIEMRSVSMIG
ncbi:MAG: AraC family transcriptional regulator [Clostridia bacterium]|nr:AraC family transcriptional regulator [Clostridia bacterium]